MTLPIQHPAGKGAAANGRIRTALAKAFSVLLLLGAVGCGGDDESDGGGGGGSVPYVSIEDPIRLDDTDPSVDLFGSASCDACPPPETSFGACPAAQPPKASAIDVSWRNRFTGTSGAAFHSIVGRCSCLFSQCFTTYEHRWSASVPLEIGDNVIEVYATDSSGGSGVDSITVSRLP